jgi:hypothetical protein
MAGKRHRFFGIGLKTPAGKVNWGGTVVKELQPLILGYTARGPAAIR